MKLDGEDIKWKMLATKIKMKKIGSKIHFNIIRNELHIEINMILRVNQITPGKILRG